MDEYGLTVKRQRSLIIFASIRHLQRRGVNHEREVTAHDCHLRSLTAVSVFKREKDKNGSCRKTNRKKEDVPILKEKLVKN